MPYTPNRPFVPDRPHGGAPVERATGHFSLPRPFVHGIAERPHAVETLPRIEDFIAPEAVVTPSVSDFAPDAYELPPIEHFIPYESDAAVAQADDTVFPPPNDASGYGDVESDLSGWEETGWQQYDWRSAAALGDAGDPEAISAWSDTDWENTTPQVREVRETAAKAIADALDGIARRIREGELVLPPPSLVPDPATITATLAALLGVRR